jgi:hypothetical protein
MVVSYTSHRDISVNNDIFYYQVERRTKTQQTPGTTLSNEDNRGETPD